MKLFEYFMNEKLFTKDRKGKKKFPILVSEGGFELLLAVRSGLANCRTDHPRTNKMSYWDF